MSTDVVITGIGVMSPIGLDVDSMWESIRDGKCGFRRTEILSHIATPGSIGGEISDFTEKSAKKSHLKSVRKQVKVMCREIQLGVASALQAVDQSGLDLEAMESERIGVDFGANLMSSPPEALLSGVLAASTDDCRTFLEDRWGIVEDDRFKGMEPLWLLKYLPNMPGCHIGIALDARGPNNSLTQAEASAGAAIAEAVGIINKGRADVMVVGTTGTKIHPVKSCHHDKWDVLADGPAESRCRPLDRDRKGEVLSEGSTTLILERRSHAEARNATIYGEILGIGASCVVEDHVPNETKAIVNASQAALRQAGLSGTDLGHVNSCASGHPDRDRFEAVAIRTVLGDNADTTPVTAPKSYLGSAGSGSGVSELAVSLLANQNGVIPKTLNFQNQDPDAPLNVVHGEHQPSENKIFLKSSVTRMGQAAVVVVG